MLAALLLAARAGRLRRRRRAGRASATERGRRELGVPGHRRAQVRHDRDRGRARARRHRRLHRPGRRARARRRPGRRRRLPRRLRLARAPVGAGRARRRGARRSSAARRSTSRPSPPQRPDLIIAINAGLKKGDYDNLSQIAPTVAQSGDYIDFGMPWDEQTMLVGQALGREDQAEKVVADVEAQVRARARASTRSSRARRRSSPTAARTATAPTPPRTRAAASSPTSASRPRSEVDELAGDAFFVQFSQEQFRLMDQDVVVMYGAAEGHPRQPGRSSASTPSRRTA